MNPQDVYHFVQMLALMHPRQRRAFFNLATHGQIPVLEEACLNLIKNPIGLSKADLAKARKYKSSDKKLANQNLSAEKKRPKLTQKGGFLNILLPLLGTVITAVLSRS